MLLICIAMLPILLGLSKTFIKTNNNLYEKYIKNFINGIPYNDENGNIREDAIAKETTMIKQNYNSHLGSTEQRFKDYSQELGIDPNQELKTNDNKAISDDEYSTYTQLYYEYNTAKKDASKSDAEYRDEAIKTINQHLININVMNNQKNIEYYVETNDGQIISNFSGESKDSIMDNTKKFSKDYVMFLDITNSSPTETHVTPNLNWVIEYLIYNNKIDTELVSFKNIIIRISNPLKSGDELYSVIKKYTISNTVGYGALLFLFLDILTISILIFLLIKQKELFIKENFLIKWYDKLFLELRALTVILMFILLFGLYHAFLFRAISNIENFIGYIVDNSNFPFLDYIDMKIFIFSVGYILIGYLVFCDIYKLYSVKITSGLKQYIYDKSIFPIICNKFRTSLFNRSMDGRLVMLLSIIILYLTSISYTIWSITTYRQDYIIITSVSISIIFTICILLYIFSFFINIYKIKLATENIINGVYNNEIKIKGSFLLQELADNIINIETGLDIALDKAIKSERLKGELITNVSHDLKTPLTSIINYVDLLDNDNISDEKRKTYLEILKERSLRLKVLIEDLFEASKASSGNLEMHMENLDPVALLRQTLGEFEDKISISNLEFIKNIPDKKLIIHADGKKTFRIFQNLISNILKYSLSGTRVYIDVEEKDEFVSITFKNISEYSLNFSEEDILERFKRGDSSRTTEGSGLGLAIAKSLVELQGGIFELKFDGDLFKAIVLLKKKKI
jgi:signal transduction histidine kinase